MSDGSSVLQRRNPATFTVKDVLTVTLDGRPVTFLNELECVEDHVYANVFMSNTILKVEKASGRVVDTFEMLELVLDSNRTPSADAVS